jgi:hypothetical protein
MSGLRRFVELGSKLLVFVNPAKVRVVRTMPNVSGTLIEFDDGSTLALVAEIEEVVSVLNEAFLIE